MKAIGQHSVDIAFSQRQVREVTVVMRSKKEWYFTFVSDDPVTKKPVVYALLTQRGKLRTWSDPRNLFDFLRERGVISGNFKLDEEQHHEAIEDPSGGG